VAGFADALGNFLPLVCTLNATRIFDATAPFLGVSLEGLTDLALDAPAGADGLTLIPYFKGEGTSTLPEATGSAHGLTLSNYTPVNMARAPLKRWSVP
jgi:xylulokinase